MINLISPEIFIEKLKKYNSNLNIKFKDSSKLMKLLGFILFFNSKFLTTFTTTICSTIYLPNKKVFDYQNSINLLITLSHEYQHTCDYLNNKFWYLFSYLFPLSILPIILLLLIFLPWYIVLILSILCFSPIPSFFRKKWEFRGYVMSMFAYNEIMKQLNFGYNERKDKLVSYANFVNNNFSNSNYYFMWPFGVKDSLLVSIKDILNEKLSDIQYKQISMALDNK